MNMKQNNVIYSVLLVALVLSVFSACDWSKRGSGSSNIKFDSIVVEKEIPLLIEGDSTLPFSDVIISFTYPIKFKNKEDLARLQQIFKGTFFGSVEYDSMTPDEAVDEYLRLYTERYKSISNLYYEDKGRLDGSSPGWYWYYMNLSNRIMFQNDSILSYAVEYSDYEGGAHGSYNVIYTNINLNELVTITEEDLFVPGYYRALTDKIVQSLMKEYNAEIPDSLLMSGFFTIEDIVPNNNFWLGENSINYTYNQYEIAPYSMGVIDVEVPYSELSDIILPNGIISRYLDSN